MVCFCQLLQEFVILEVPRGILVEFPLCALTCMIRKAAHGMFIEAIKKSMRAGGVGQESYQSLTCAAPKILMLRLKSGRRVHI